MRTGSEIQAAIMQRERTARLHRQVGEFFMTAGGGIEGHQ